MSEQRRQRREVEFEELMDSCSLAKHTCVLCQTRFFSMGSAVKHVLAAHRGAARKRRREAVRRIKVIAKGYSHNAEDSSETEEEIKSKRRRL